MRQIAAVFAGVRKETFAAVAREMPLMPGAADAIIALRKAGYRVGIVTDSYRVAAETIRRRVFADFSFSHVMRFKNGKATGRVNICPAMRHPNGCTIHDHCKLNVMLHLMERFDLTASQFLAVADGENDVCLLKAVGQSIAFQGKTRNVRLAANFKTNNLADIPSFLTEESRPRNSRRRNLGGLPENLSDTTVSN